LPTIIPTYYPKTKLSIGSITDHFISQPEYIIALGIFLLFCIVIFLGVKQKRRHRGVKMGTNVGIITMGGLYKEWSDIDFFDEDIPGAAGFVSPLSTAGNEMNTGELS